MSVDPAERSALARALYLGVGLISVALGTAGIVLPLLPTTPFILLAAWCFARGSHRLEAWLRGHRLYGAIVASWQSGEGIPRRAKAAAVTLLWVAIAFSLWSLQGHLAVQLGLVAFAVVASIVLLRLPTAPRRAAPLPGT